MVYFMRDSQSNKEFVFCVPIASASRSYTPADLARSCSSVTRSGVNCARLFPDSSSASISLNLDKEGF